MLDDHMIPNIKIAKFVQMSIAKPLYLSISINVRDEHNIEIKWTAPSFDLEAFAVAVLHPILSA